MEIRSNIFGKRLDIPCNPQQLSEFQILYVRTVYQFGERLPYLGFKIWDIFPTDMKNVTPLNVIKNPNEMWKLYLLTMENIITWRLFFYNAFCPLNDFTTWFLRCV